MKKIFMLCSLLIALHLPTSLSATVPSELAQKLESPEPAVRLNALRHIAVNYSSEALPFLVQAVEDTDPLVRERAIQGLGLSGSSQSATLVRKALKDSDEYVRWRAVQALDRLGARDVGDELAPLVEDQNWLVRVATLDLLGTMRWEQVRMMSVDQAEMTSAERIKALLLHGLGDRDERVKLAAAGALAKSRDGEAYDPLIELLGTGSLFIRDGAALALGDLANPRAIRPMIDALAEPRNLRSEEGSDWVCWGIVKALRSLTGQDFGLDVEKWNHWYDANRNKRVSFAIFQLRTASLQYRAPIAFAAL